MAKAFITNRFTARDRTGNGSPARTGRTQPVVRRDLAPTRDRSRWIETAYLAEIGAQLDRQSRVR